jgi:hypothetical protein
VTAPLRVSDGRFCSQKHIFYSKHNRRAGEYPGAHCWSFPSIAHVEYTAQVQQGKDVSYIWKRAQKDPGRLTARRYMSESCVTPISTSLRFTLVVGTMDDLAARVEALEVGATFEATQHEVQRIQYDLLLKLREIRAGLQANQGGGLLSATTATELEALKAENGALKLKNSKLEYRVEIMKSSIEELLAAQKPSKA